MNSTAGRRRFAVLALAGILLVGVLVAAVYLSGSIFGPASALPSPAPTLALRIPFQRGVVYASWHQGESSEAESDQTLATLVKPMGVNRISIVVTCYQTDSQATDIRCDGDGTATDDDVRHAADYAHGLGLQVMLKPHIDVDGGDWRGEIDMGDDEAAWQAWFANYTSFITHYAKLAQEVSAEYFVIGTELQGTSNREVEWRAVIAAARAEYHGPLTYAANHGEEVLAVKWWDAVDAIGVDAYYPLTESDSPTAAELKAAWSPVVERLGLLSRQWDRPIILTEVGYQSRDGANRTPWHVDTKVVDLQEQADSYQAVFDSFAGHDWWQGVFWWYWNVHLDQGGPDHNGFTANNKPAENVLRLNYGAPPRPNK